MRIGWWTLAFQGINFLILVWLMERFFYRPVVAIIEKRRAATAKLLADASAARTEAGTEMAGIAATRQGFAVEREQILAAARKEAESERDAMLKEAAEAAARTRVDNDKKLALERVAMEQAMMQRAGALAVDIARQLLETLPANMALTAFLDALADRMQALPQQTRDLVAAAGSGGFEVVTAAPLDNAQQEQCRKSLESILGAQAAIAFRCDPGLIAGIEIHGGAIVLRNSWRDDLARILEGLGSDDGQRQIS